MEMVKGLPCKKGILTAFIALISIYLINYFAVFGLYKDGGYFIFLCSFLMLLAGFCAEVKYLGLMISAMLILLLPDMVNIYRGYSSFSDLEKISRNILLVFPAALLIREARISHEGVARIITIVLLYTLLFAVLQKEGLYAEDANHFNGKNPGIWFNKGSFSSAVVLFYSVFIGNFLIGWPRIGSMWLLASFTACAITLYLTEARGPFLAFAVVNILFLAAFSVKYLHKRQLVLVAALSFTGMVIAFYGLSERFMLAVEELNAYLRDDAIRTSTGIRIETWKMAWHVFLTDPVWGKGVQGAFEVKRELVSSGMFLKFLLGYHTHSEYFSIIERGGIFGVLCFAAFLGVLYYIFRSYNVSFFMMLPLAFVLVALFVIGLTSATLRNNIGANAFFMCVLITQVAALNASSQVKSDESNA